MAGLEIKGLLSIVYKDANKLHERAENVPLLTSATCKK